MNIINIHRNNNVLEVQVNSPFNLCIRNMIESRLSDEIKILKLDLSLCKLLDSEAVIFMYQWEKSGNSLQLVNPPEILFEIMNILELSKVWQPSYRKTKGD